MQILNLAVIHKPSYPWQYVEGNYCYLRVKTCLPVQAITVWYGDPFWFSGPEKKPQLSCCEMQPTQRMPDSQLYAVSIRMQTHKLHYYFVIKLQTDISMFPMFFHRRIVSHLHGQAVLHGIRFFRIGFAMRKIIMTQRSLSQPVIIFMVVR